MDRELTKVLVERERIRARIERERSTVATHYRALERPAVYVDHVLEGVRFLRVHPLAVGGAVAAIAVLRTRSLVRLAIRGIGVWRSLRRLQRLAHTIGL